MHLESRYGISEAYKLQEGRFEMNQAFDLGRMTGTSGIPALTTWQGKRSEALRESGSEWLQCTDCIYGQGGALFIGMHNTRRDATVNLMLQKLSINNNSASVGGGIYLENEFLNHERATDKWCTSFIAKPDPCECLAFKQVVVKNNRAFITAGGLFIRSPKNLDPFCVMDLHNSTNICTIGQDQDALQLQTNEILDDGGGYGPDLATGADRLLIQNIEEPISGLKSGEKLVAHRQENAEDPPSGDVEIQLVVKDKLDQTVTGGTKDAEIKVLLVSKWISGDREYNAQTGNITINDTFVAAINRQVTVVFTTADERNISVILEFSALPCSDGELYSEARASCFRCRKNFYSFRASQDGCQLCEDNAICDGTTALVPQDYYWHANPFSPVMRRCLVKKACMYKGREDALMKYYDVYEQVKAELAKFGEQNAVESLDFFASYPQCASGYKGTLCGTCAGNYGHTSGGACKECDQNLGLTRFLTVLIIIALFGVITFKVVLEIRGVVEDVSFELAQQRTAIESFIGQASNQALVGHGSVRSEQNVDSATSSQPRTERAERTEMTEASSTGAGLSAGSSVRRPLLQRLDKIEDPTAETEKDADTPSPELMDASASLSDTYNILYNYMQLNSVALSLDVDWTKTLRYFFSVEASLARLMDIQFLPFDCSFGDREDDSGFPNSLASLWYRVCFPLMTIAVYLLAMKIYVWIRGERRRSKYQVGLPTMRLIFLVVYLSCCIDIFADLLRVMKCVDLTPDIPENHPYAKYEVMERKSVWMGDTAVTCWEGAHLASAIVAGIGLCVCLGIIVFTVIILFVGKRGRRLRNPQFLLSYGFLYLSYRTDGVALYWESVITLRRMLMAAVGVYAEHGETSNVQIGFLAFIIFIFIAVHEVVGPFDQEDSKDVIPSYAGHGLRILGANDVADQWLAFNQYVTLNGMEGASLFMSLSLFLVATSINDEKDNKNEINFLLIVCFAVNAVFVLFMLLRLWYGVHHYLDVIAKERNITFRAGAVPGQDSVSSFPKKLWIILKSSRKDLIVEERDEGEP